MVRIVSLSSFIQIDPACAWYSDWFWTYGLYILHYCLLTDTVNFVKMWHWSWDLKIEEQMARGWCVRRLWGRKELGGGPKALWLVGDGGVTQPQSGRGRGRVTRSKGFRFYPKCKGNSLKVLSCLAVLVWFITFLVPWVTWSFTLHEYSTFDFNPFVFFLGLMLVGSPWQEVEFGKWQLLLLLLVLDTVSQSHCLFAIQTVYLLSRPLRGSRLYLCNHV